MEIKPVTHIDKPRYPLKYELKDETLKASVPMRWAGSAAAKAALGTLAVVTLAGCAATGAPIPSSTAPGEDAIVSPAVQLTPQSTPSPVVINVAPLFIHGEGRGAYGCDMVTPPAFISEDEALTVINEVAREYGLEFSDKNKAEFSTVLRPVTHLIELSPPDPGAIAPPDVFVTYRTDFSDEAHGVAIEFVSVEDVKSWCKEGGGTIEEYDTMGAAGQLGSALEYSTPSGGYFTAGVLYDPCWMSESSDAKTYSEGELKKQAKDFFEWLKAQGVI